MEQGLRKGPWSKQEDEILKEYVKIYGPKKWNALQRLTGLPREGKSCRLRWLNHLNPNLRKAKFSEEEKQKILQLRQLDGKWCEIVKQFPGKTDNEIKNFYNINERKKRKMENGNGECRKKKRNYLSLNDEIMKLHDNELKDNGENSLSGFISNEQKDISDTHERELMKDSFHIPIMQPSNMLCNNVASTSISNNSSPTFIDRGEAPFMPTDMVLDLPPLLEIESPLPSYASMSNNSSPTFIDRGETSFTSMDMKSSLPPLPLPLQESIDFESLESPLIHKYPPLPLRSPEEIQQEQLLEPDTPSNNGFLVVGENGKKPISLKKDESKNEDLIDLLDSLGWLDGYIF